MTHSYLQLHIRTHTHSLLHTLSLTHTLSHTHTSNMRHDSFKSAASNEQEAAKFVPPTTHTHTFISGAMSKEAAKFLHTHTRTHTHTHAHIHTHTHTLLTDASNEQGGHQILYTHTIF